MVTVGRVLLRRVQRWVPARLAYHVLPLVLAGAFVLVAELPDDTPALGVLAFGLAGLGCSALVAPHDQFRSGGADGDLGGVAGGVIAFYQAGYGIAAFGVGPLLDNGVELTTIFDVAAVWRSCWPVRRSSSHAGGRARRRSIHSLVQAGQGNARKET